MDRKKVIAIVGLTSSGKTALSIAVAKAVGRLPAGGQGEVVSADSRQVYRGLDIGTGKVTPEEMEGVPHHLLDVANPEESFSVADFVTRATEALEEIEERGNIPLIVGGTGFYTDALLGRVSLADVPPNEALRKKLEVMPLQKLQKKLRAEDPERFATIDRENPRRLIRAIEVARSSGVAPKRAPSPRYNVLWIGVTLPKDELRAKMRERAEAWLEAGLLEEVKRLLARGIPRHRLEEIGFEYLLALALYDGTIDRAQYLSRFVEKNWQYAKRQMTWFKRNKDIHWFRSGEEEDVLALVRKFINTPA